MLDEYKMKKYLLSLLALIYVGTIQAANDKFYLNKLNYCKITPPAINNYEPSQFQHTNNLLKGAGEYPLYCGRKIVIRGKVLDQNCVPVSDAKIYLWQKGCDGKYPYHPLRNNINKELLNVAANSSTFKGSGTATTNNLGEFYFVTIYPPASKNEASNVNIRVEHRDLGQLQTRLVLSNKNILEEYNEISNNLSEIINDYVVYHFDIVLKGETLKRY